MKIVLLASNSGSGGLIKYINAFCLSSNFDNDVFLICGKNLNINQGHNIRIIRTEFANESGIELILNKKINNNLKSIIDKINPDLILFMNGYIRKGLENYKCISILHNQLSVNLKMILKLKKVRLIISMLAVRKAVYKSFLKSDGIIFLSHASKNDVDRKKIKYKDSRVILFGHKSDFNTGERTVLPLQLIYVSTGFAYKNHFRLIKAINIICKKQNNLVLNIIGCDPSKKIKKFINKNHLNANIIYHGWINHEKTQDLIKKSNIYIHASLIESTSNGVLEGVIEGNKIVCSKIPVFEEALGNSAFYFDPKSVNDIANTITCAINSEKVLSAEECERILRPYSMEKAVESTYEYAKYIVNSGDNNE